MYTKSMPVNRVRRARAAETIAISALDRRLGDLIDNANIYDGNGTLSMIPIYSISARNIVAGRWNRGWRSGWRYFWTHPELDEGATIEVRREGKEAHLASTSWGTGAHFLSDQLADAVAKLAGHRHRYRPRILRLPWISMEAIWFNTDSLDIPDKFIDRDGKIHNAAFRKEAKRRARAFLASLNKSNAEPLA